MTLLARLEERGYRRRDILDLPVAYVAQVLGHPRDGDTGALEPQYRAGAGKALSHRDLVEATLRRRKVPEHRLREVADRVLAEQERRGARKGKKKGGGRGAAGRHEGAAG